MDVLAVNLESEPPAFDEDERMPRPEDILKMCGSLVRIDYNPEGRNSLGEIAAVQTITAAHTSVIDFLKTQPVCIGSDLKTSFTQGSINFEATKTCLI